MFNDQKDTSCRNSAFLAICLIAVCTMLVMTQATCRGEDPAPIDRELSPDSTAEAPPTTSRMTCVYGPRGPHLLFVYSSSLIAFIATLVCTVRGSSPFLCLAFVPLPLVAGVYACVSGMLDSYEVLSLSTIEPKLSELVAMLAAGFYSLREGLLFAIPSYLIAVSGLVYRETHRNPAEK